MTKDDRKRLAGCVAILSGCFGFAIVVVILVGFTLGVGVKIFHMVGH